MFPAAQFTAGADAAKLVVLARPAEHDAIKAAVEQMSQKEAAATAYKLVVYALHSAAPAGAAPGAAGKAAAAKSAGAVTILPILRQMFPTAQFSPGPDSDKLLAWARPTDHAEIQKAIDELAKPEAPELAPKVVVYTVEGTPAVNAALVLRTMFPTAQFTPGADTTKLIALARPAEHEAIKAAVEQMSQKEPPETTFRLSVYIIESTASSASPGAAARAGGALSLITVLRPMFPSAQFSVGADPRRLVAWARPADQEQIKKAVDEMAKKEPPENAPQVLVYTVETTSAINAAVILRVMFPDAVFSPGNDASKVVVLADRPITQQSRKPSNSCRKRNLTPQPFGWWFTRCRRSARRAARRHPQRAGQPSPPAQPLRQAGRRELPRWYRCSS